MPLYQYICEDGHSFERMLKLADYRLPQICECGEGARRQIFAPSVLSDYIEPCMGADGKMHDSKASLRATYLPSGNPRGERFLELGNDKIETKPVEFDRKKRRDDIKAAIQDVKYGRVAPIPQGPPA